MILLLMLGISEWSKFASGVDTNAFVGLAFLHCFGLPLLCLLFYLVVVLKSSNLVAGLALGVSMFLTGLALGAIAPLWGASDNSFIFLPFEGGLVSLAGLQLVIITSIRILRRHLPFTPVLYGTMLALAGALFVILWLFWRGPGDWATVSHEVRLFSFPIIVGGIVIGWGIYQITRHASRTTHHAPSASGD